jgi:hypothetical protein
MPPSQWKKQLPGHGDMPAVTFFTVSLHGYFF